MATKKKAEVTEEEVLEQEAEVTQEKAKPASKWDEKVTVMVPRKQKWDYYYV